MDVAKAVMEQLIRDLPDGPNLMVALRIYEAELRKDFTPCEDTVLAQPFAPVAKARQNMIDQVKSMKARRMTPIALSLGQAALVRCICQYYSASDTASLRQALSTMMAAPWPRRT